MWRHPFFGDVAPSNPVLVGPDESWVFLASEDFPAGGSGMSDAEVMSLLPYAVVDTRDLPLLNLDAVRAPLY